MFTTFIVYLVVLGILGTAAVLSFRSIRGYAAASFDHRKPTRAHKVARKTRIDHTEWHGYDDDAGFSSRPNT